MICLCCITTYPTIHHSSPVPPVPRHPSATPALARRIIAVTGAKICHRSVFRTLGPLTARHRVHSTVTRTGRIKLCDMPTLQSRRLNACCRVRTTSCRTFRGTTGALTPLSPTAGLTSRIVDARRTVRAVLQAVTKSDLKLKLLKN